MVDWNRTVSDGDLPLTVFQDLIMRVLHAIQGYPPWIGGSQRFFQEISERLVAEGHQVILATTDAGELEHFWARDRQSVGPSQEFINGVHVRRFAVKRCLNQPFFFSFYRRLMAELSDLPVDLVALLRQLTRFTPRLPDYEAYLSATNEHFDLVHGGNITLDFMLWPAFDFARGHGIPFVVTPFTHFGAPGQRRVRRYYTMQHHQYLLRFADAVITQTQLESDLWSGLGVQRERLVCTGSGANPKEAMSGDGKRFRERHQLAGPIVFYVGTLAYDKGTIHTVKAMHRLWDEGRQVHLVLAGQIMSHVRRYLERLPSDVASRMHVLGFISEEEKRDLLAAGDLFCMPSCTDSFGMGYLEAWTNGVPVIGARAGGVPAVIDDGVNGLLVDFGDVVELSEAITRILDDPALGAEMGRRGREKVYAEMTWERVYERVRRVYQKLSSSE
jgi:glycosyltransferase involved in cell wall biosynthesis